jgi:DNA helicase-2/ATP-dependent DNA helicase PcrA
MKVIADLHLHSRFSRAVSGKMRLPEISKWAMKKGIELVATGDWTHPVWFRELKANLVEVAEGVYEYRGEELDGTKDAETKLKFLLSTEVSSIYSQGEKTRRIHTLILAPNLDTVEKINKELSARGVNLLSDGRPIMGLSAKAVAEIVLTIERNCLLIPAHAWTPWFSLYGSMSGFDSIQECFGDFATNIYAIETGLSSDPAMNWRIEELENLSIISSSDAHSPQKLGREATVFEISDQKSELSYSLIREAITGPSSKNQPLKAKIAYTIEFYPEEGKYHYTGHRKCQVIYSPNEARKMGTICPVCGKPLTVGVMSRVESLAGGDVETESETDEYGVRWIKPTKTSLRAEGATSRRPYVMLVPLLEILSEALSAGVGTKTVLAVYDQLINSFGSEFKVLLETELEDVTRVSGEKVSEAIGKVRSGDIVIKPGYDGVFGDVRIWKEEEIPVEVQVDRTTLF